MVNPVSEPASSRAKPCASLKNVSDFFCPFSARCWPSEEENRPWSEIRFRLRNLPARAFLFSRIRVQLDYSTIELPSAVDKPCAYLPDRVCHGMLARAAALYQAFRDSAPCLACHHPPEGIPDSRSGRGAPGIHHPQPTKSTPRLDRSAAWRRQPVGCIS